MTATPAITGSLPRKKDNPAVPITVAEQVESTQASTGGRSGAGQERGATLSQARHGVAVSAGRAPGSRANLP